MPQYFCNGQINYRCAESTSGWEVAGIGKRPRWPGANGLHDSSLEGTGFETSVPRHLINFSHQVQQIGHGDGLVANFDWTGPVQRLVPTPIHIRGGSAIALLGVYSPETFGRSGACQRTNFSIVQTAPARKLSA